MNHRIKSFWDGMIAGAAIMGVVMYFTSCTPTGPEDPQPCTKQEIHHGDTVTVPCVMHGRMGEP